VQSRISSSTWRLLGFVAFWAAQAVWSVWLLGVTGLASWNPAGISVDLPWYGWLALLAWATWLAGVIEHHRPRSGRRNPSPPTSPRCHGRADLTPSATNGMERR
jgi:hypothetical protein